jgi:hypothetical protein
MIIVPSRCSRIAVRCNEPRTSRGQVTNLLSTLAANNSIAMQSDLSKRVTCADLSLLVCSP